MKLYQVAFCEDREAQARLVRQGDQHFDEQMQALAEALNAQSLRFIGLTGPTCAGKTTAAKRLTDRLQQFGKRVHVVSLDDFYHQKEYLHELARRKGRSEPDYDSEDTINATLLRSCVESLLEGRPTRMPRFNFKTGKREEGELLQMGENDSILLEGIQLLYPRVDAILQGKPYQSIFIGPLTALEVAGERFEPNEIRLLRRLVRDHHFRNTDAAFTLTLWKSVRENEERSIFPYVGHCTYRIDSTMPYDPGMLRPYLEAILPRIEKESPQWAQAQDILKKIQSVQVIPSDLIAPDSLYKEFI